MSSNLPSEAAAAQVGRRLRSYHTPWFAALAVGLALAGCAAHPTPPTLARFEFDRPEMGMPFRIVLYAPDAAVAQAAASAAFDRVHELNQVFSDYEDDSELTLLSRTAGQGRPVPVSPHLWNVLTRAQKLSAQSEGAFDVTVGPVVQLWRRARRQHQLPHPDQLRKALQTVGYQKLALDTRTRTAQLMVPGMRLDLGAIAKGYAIDAAMEVLRGRGIRRALVGCSGDMLAAEPPPGRPGWRVALGGLEATHAPPTEYVLLRHQALATSGDFFQFVDIDGVRYSHIVDPRTGVGLTDHSQVTVVAADCATADSLATTLSVLGPARGLALVEGLRGPGARIVRSPQDHRELHETRRFPPRHQFSAQPGSVE